MTALAVIYLGHFKNCYVIVIVIVSCLSRITSLWLNCRFKADKDKTYKFVVNVEFPGLPVEYSVNKGYTWFKMSGSTINATKSTDYLFVTRSARSPLFLSTVGNSRK